MAEAHICNIGHFPLCTAVSGSTLNRLSVSTLDAISSATRAIDRV